MDLAWERFWWVQGTQEAYHADQLAMVLRSAEAGGAARWHQLDLGGSGAMPYGVPETHQASAEASRLPGQLWGLLGSTAHFEFYSPIPDSLRNTWGQREIGTLGLPLYLTSALVIDFAHQRLATIPPPNDLALLLGPKGSSVPIEGGYERVLFPITAKDGPSHKALLDTGLSPFPLWTTYKVWRQLTGVVETAKTTRRYTLSHPRGHLVFVGAPLKAKVQIGAWRMPKTEVVYLAEGPEDVKLEAWTPALDAVVGPALFARDAILVLDLSHRRLGIGRGRLR